VRAVVVERPEPFIDLVTAKEHVRVSHDDDDAIISGMVSAAISHIDGPEAWLGRSLAPQTLELRLDAYPCDGLVSLPCGPVIDVLSVKYIDGAGVLQTIDPGAYLADDLYVWPLYGTTWPTLRRERGSARIRYRAGYVADPAADPLVAQLPDAIAAAVLLMVGDLYANRETTVAGQVFAVPMSTTVEALLSPYRVMRV
jgi:uncharacterized phiE125 gp8 family phage protein